MSHGAKKPREQAELRHYKCILLMIVLAATLYGCSSATPYSHPEFAKRMDAIKSIAVLPPNVAVYGGSANALMKEKSETLQEQLDEGFATTFRRSERLTAKYFVPGHNSTQAEEFISLRPSKLEMDACLPTPVLALREAVDADGLLITRAIELNWSDDPELSRIRTGLAVGLLLHPSTVVVTPAVLIGSLVSTRVRQALFAGGVTALQICLVDTRTGDDLWSYSQEFTGADALQDPELARTAVDEAFKNFQSGLAKEPGAAGKPK